MPAITPGLKGTSRKRALQAHRLLVYVAAMDKYMKHEVSLKYVIARANKCIEAGLRPKL